MAANEVQEGPRRCREGYCRVLEEPLGTARDTVGHVYSSNSENTYANL